MKEKTYLRIVGKEFKLSGQNGPNSESRFVSKTIGVCKVWYYDLAHSAAIDSLFARLVAEPRRVRVSPVQNSLAGGVTDRIAKQK